MVRGNYKEKRCIICGKTFYVSNGGGGRKNQKRTRPRMAVTCSPKCSKINTDTKQGYSVKVCNYN